MQFPKKKPEISPNLITLWPSNIFLGGSGDKEYAYNAGCPSSIPGSGRSPGEENGNPLRYSRLGNPMDRGAWWAALHVVAQSYTTERLTLMFVCGITQKMHHLNEYGWKDSKFTKFRASWSLNWKNMSGSFGKKVKGNRYHLWERQIFCCLWMLYLQRQMKEKQENYFEITSSVVFLLLLLFNH